MANITVVGLGAMGSALARCLLNNDHAVTVWNRTADKANALVEAGATRAHTLEQAMAASPLILTCLKNNDTTLQPLRSLGNTLSGKTVFDLSTGGAAEAIALVSELETQGADFMLGMINAYPSQIGEDSTAILTASSPDA